VPTARSPIFGALAAAAALAPACAIAACGGSDPVADALDQQTVTAVVSDAIGTSTAPVAPRQAPVAPGSIEGSGGAEEPAGTERDAGASGGAGGDAEPATPAAEPGAAATRTRPQLTVHLTRSTKLRASPGGAAIARLSPTTEFRSPTVLAVVRQRGSWLGVLTPALPNGRIGWISARATYEVHYSGYRVDASLRRREVVVRRNGRVVQRFPVAIGSESSPTPRGRFAVTDKLLTQSSSSPYGCCILALSGHQTATPQGWGGGDRIAIHATNLPETIGLRASLGCLRAPTEAIRRVVDSVPLGTVVHITA
jgi:lipoprotein-anchoring transpeptidase ErfK/SrfK